MGPESWGPSMPGRYLGQAHEGHIGRTQEAGM